MVMKLSAGHPFCEFFGGLLNLVRHLAQVGVEGDPPTRLLMGKFHRDIGKQCCFLASGNDIVSQILP
jgi:hypothetical protein